jgi:DNA polymerase-1
MISVIDADSMVWVHAYLNRDHDELDRVIAAVDESIHDILMTTKATHYLGFVQGSRNTFRHTMFPSYKANRKAENPGFMDKWKTQIFDHLTGAWKFVPVVGVEVDDAVACAAKCFRDQKRDYTICGIDKDLAQIEGNHYNYDPKKRFSVYIDSSTAMRNLCLQILHGDSTDNIKGIPGIGPKTAKRILDHAPEEVIDLTTTGLAYLNYYFPDRRKGLLEFAENVLLVTLQDDLKNVFAETDIYPAPTSTIQQINPFKRED